MSENDHLDLMDDDVTGIIIHCNRCDYKQKLSFCQLCLDNMMHRSQIYQGVKRRKCPKCNASLVIIKYLFDDSKILDNHVNKYSKRKRGY